MPAGDGGVLDRLEPTQQDRRSVEGCGDALARYLEGAHVLAHRWDGSRAAHPTAGEKRRRAELGLPVLLAARCYAHAARADERRLLRRSAIMARLAVARRRGPSPSSSGRLWRSGRAGADRMGGAG